MRNHHAVALVPLLCALAPGAVAAQSDYQPVSLHIEDDWLSPTPDTLVVQIEVSGQPTRSITQVETLRRASASGTEQLLQVMEAHVPRGVLVDTIRHRLEDLTPISRVSRTPADVLRLRYDGAHVSGERETAEETDSFAVDVEGRVFDPSALTLLLRFAPLEESYHVRLPYFDSDKKATQWAEIEVVGREMLELRSGTRVPTWIVRMTLPGGRAADHWIGESGRRLLRLEARPAPGTIMTAQR